jgi:aryl-alcohol dehydrogenase-like predicted oxidoreductase
MRQYIFGTAGLHRIAWRPDRRALLDLAFDVGFRAFDTAPLYGNGLAEREIGETFRGRRAKIQITTKFGIPISPYGAARPWTFVAERAARIVLDRNYRASFDRRDWSAAAMTEGLEASLRRLKTDHVDRFCLHEPLSPLPADVWQDLSAAADRLKQAGKILAFGVSGEAACIPDLAARPGIDFVQTRAGRIPSLPAGFNGAILVYGLYGQFRAGDGGGDFVQFLKDEHRIRGAAGVLLSSTKPAAVKAYAPLFPPAIQ